MKLSVFLMLVACLHASAKSYSQEKVSINERQVSLRSVLQDIQRQTGCSFVLNSEVNEAMPKLNLELKNASIREVLDACLKGQPFAYVINLTNKVITIQRVTPEIAVQGSGRENILREIRGKVVNEKGQAMPGVSVFIKGSTNGTTTDENGLFVLTGYTGSDPELRVSFVGYGQQIVKWSSGMVIKMQPSAAVLQDVSVRYYNNGYEKLSPERSPGSYSVIDEKVLNQAVTPDLLSRLNGRLGSAYFGKIGDGSPGNIIIRGLSTINTGTAPLIVVDNFPYAGDISNINPNDVESVTELRDANAASVWGAQAGNGVLVITTKKGKYGQPFQVSFNGNVTIQNRPNLYYDRSYLDSKDFIDVEKMLYGKGFYNSDFSSSDYRVISPVVQTLHDRDAGLISAADADKKIASYQNIDNRDQRSKYFYQKGVNQQYSLSFSGGNQNLNYYISMGYDRILSNTVGNDNNKQTLHSVTNFTPAKKLDIQFGLDYTHSRGNYDAFGLNTFYAGGGKGSYYPYATLVDGNGNHTILPKDYSQTFKDTTGAGRLLNWNYSPLDEYGKSDNRTDANTLIFNISTKYSFSKSLNLNVLYQFTRVFGNQRYYRSVQSYAGRSLINQYTQRGSGTTLVYPIPVGGMLDESNSNTVAHNFRPVLSFNHTWGTRHELNAIAGMEISQNHSTSTSDNTTYGYDDNLLTFKNVNYADGNYDYWDFIGYSSNIPTAIGYTDVLNRFVSYYTNFAYTYDKKYTLSGSVKKDESNLFGVNSNAKGVPLWSGGLKWDITRENFYHVKFLPVLALKATYGYCGNVNNSLSAISTIGYAGYPATYTSLTFAAPGNPNNPDLRWEKVGQLNLGLDFAIKKNIVSGRVEYYSKKAVDLLAFAPIDYTTGYTAVTRNVANLKTQGVDVELRFKILDNGFKWNSQILASYVKSTVTKYYLTNPSYSALVTYGTSIVPVEGHDAYSLFSYNFAGLDPATGDPRGIVNKQISKDYVSLLKPASINDLSEAGASKAPYFGSFYNTFSWKGFSATIGITGNFNYYFRKPTINYYSLFNSWTANVDYLKRWQKPGDEATTTIPSMIYPANNNRDQFYQMSSATVLKGDVIRIRDISVSYDFRPLRFGNYTLKKISIYSYLNNVGIIWRANKEGIDPDVVSGYPVPFSMAFGVRATL